MAHRPKTPEERLADIQAQKAALRVREQDIELEIRARKQRMDARRVMVIGKALWRQAEASPAARARLNALLDPLLKNPRDRALFDLPMRPQEGGA